MARTKVFISYSHEDERWRKRVAGQLAILEHSALLTVWDDRKIKPGETLLARLNEEMSVARVAILLLSANFLSSKFILEREVPKLLGRHERDGMTIYPLLIRACAWQHVPWLAQLQIRPRGAKPVSSFRGPDADKVLADVTAEIAGIVYDSHPPMPANLSRSDDLDLDGRKRQHDVDQLRTLLSAMHLPTMDEFLEGIRSGTIPRRVMHFWEGLNGIVSSSLFHLYDPTASSLLTAFHRSWGESLDFGDYFQRDPSGHHYSFHATGGADDRKAWAKMQRVARKTTKAFRGFLKHVRDNYLEIDIVETSSDAWQEYLEFRSEMNKLFNRKEKST